MLAVGLFTAAVALAAPALAQTSVNSVSIIAVLATALPQSLVNLALTNPGAASSIIKSVRRGAPTASSIPLMNLVWLTCARLGIRCRTHARVVLRPA